MRRRTSASAIFSLRETLFEDDIATTGRTPNVIFFNLSLFIADGHIAALAQHSDTRSKIFQIYEDALHNNTTNFGPPSTQLIRPGIGFFDELRCYLFVAKDDHCRSPGGAQRNPGAALPHGGARPGLP
jgi:hypothetical protein